MEKLGINIIHHLEKNALILWKFENNKRICETVKYSDLLKQALKISIFIEEQGLPFKSSVGILAKKSYALIALTLGIIEQNQGFAYLTNDDIQSNYLDNYDVKYFFSDSQISDTNNDINLIKKLIVCEQNIYFYKTNSKKISKIFRDGDNEMNRICYTVTTSGSTGKRKIVRVTYNSIFPNIKSLQEIFQLDSNDVILSSAPVTFDVFIMDLFLAFYSGAALMIIENELRFDPFIFGSTESTSVTFLQITPTIFQKYGIENIQSKIMHEQSRLKYLIFGGEKFPNTQEVLTWQDWKNPKHKRIFNIYGITEMSCWSLIHEVTYADLEFGRVPLGNPLADTSVGYYSHNSDDIKINVEELILTSSKRVNFIDDSNWDNKLGTDAVFAYITKDLVEKIDGKIYWYGRLDDLVKRFGERVDLTQIERVAGEIISPVAAILIKNKIVLFYQAANKQNEELLTNHLRLKLKSSQFPDDIKRIDFLPTCDHGKISKKKLKELYREILKEEFEKKNAEDIFLDAINQIFNLKLSLPSKKTTDEPDGKRMRLETDSTFIQIGGSSFDALRVAMKIEDKIEVNSNGLLLPKLLDNRHSIKDIFSYLKELKLKPKDYKYSKYIQSSPVTPLIEYKNLEKFDLEKCVDSSPALITFGERNFIAVGSHSGKFIVIDVLDFSKVEIIKLNDRIECEAIKFNDNILVGSYDGFLYCLNIFNEIKIKWKFDSGAMIKSKALVIKDEFIIFGNYNYKQNLRCIRAVNDNNETLVEVIWTKMIGSSGIIANLIQIDENSLLVCTLDGTCERLNTHNGNSIWKKQFEYPIFSTPVRINDTNKILVAEVMRKIHCIDINGNSIWNFQTEGHVFSSFSLNTKSDSDVEIIFGSHDKKLRCLRYDCDKELKPSLQWEIELQSQIYGTPKILKIDGKKNVVSCSTNGYVNLIDIELGLHKNSFKLPGELFSTPLIFRDNIWIGCRDNFLYCLKIK